MSTIVTKPNTAKLDKPKVINIESTTNKQYKREKQIILFKSAALKAYCFNPYRG